MLASGDGSTAIQTYSSLASSREVLYPGLKGNPRNFRYAARQTYSLELSAKEVLGPGPEL